MRVFLRVALPVLIGAVLALIVIAVLQGWFGHTRKDVAASHRICAGSAQELPMLQSGWLELFDLPLDHPARFALNEIADRNAWRAFCLLRGEWAGTDTERAQAAHILAQLRKRIDLGMVWPHTSIPEYQIPFCVKTPVIDGNLAPEEWSSALIFCDSYLVNAAQPVKDGSRWLIQWDERFLYVGASFLDSAVLAGNPPYAGDALEIFLLPSMRVKKYWEIVIGASGELYTGFQCNNRYGGWTSDPAERMRGLQFQATRSTTGFQIEAAIPFSELPNYMLGNAPKAGQTINFALVRTQKSQQPSEVEYFSAYPLLYGGHNIFGHAVGKLMAPRVRPGRIEDL